PVALSAVSAGPSQRVVPRQDQRIHLSIRRLRERATLRGAPARSELSRVRQCAPPPVSLSFRSSRPASERLPEVRRSSGESRTGDGERSPLGAARCAPFL